MFFIKSSLLLPGMDARTSGFAKLRASPEIASPPGKQPRADSRALRASKQDSAVPDWPPSPFPRASLSLRHRCFPLQVGGFTGLAPKCIKFESIAVVSNFNRIRFKYKFNYPKL